MIDADKIRQLKEENEKLKEENSQLQFEISNVKCRSEASVAYAKKAREKISDLKQEVENNKSIIQRFFDVIKAIF